MGLRDIFNGMQNGPRGQRQPSISGSGGGMSRIMMALLGLLAHDRARTTIPKVALPRKDPVYGRDGLLIGFWRRHK